MIQKREVYPVKVREISNVLWKRSLNNESKIRSRNGFLYFTQRKAGNSEPDKSNEVDNVAHQVWRRKIKYNLLRSVKRISKRKRKNAGKKQPKNQRKRKTKQKVKPTKNNRKKKNSNRKNQNKDKMKDANKGRKKGKGNKRKSKKRQKLKKQHRKKKTGRKKDGKKKKGKNRKSVIILNGDYKVCMDPSGYCDNAQIITDSKQPPPEEPPTPSKNK